MFIAECAKNGIIVKINETIREEFTQLLYFLQGTLDTIVAKNPNIYNEFNALRKRHKFWELSKDEMNRRITWTLDSKHFYGKAFDAVPLNDKGQPNWNAPDEIWKKMAECAEKVGLYPGINFGDKPHFENRS